MPTFESLQDVASLIRTDLEDKRFALIYAHNGTGETRLSTEFKNLGRQGDHRDTLYFNAFTEDLFTWDNDLQHDRERILKLNSATRFFDGFFELEMDTRIKKFLDPYCDFDFRFERGTEKGDYFVFSRRAAGPTGAEAEASFTKGIKISRGEEQLFKWCFFLAILQATLDGSEAYKWVEYVYIDDPVSSLDEHNAIALANRLVAMFQDAEVHEGQ